MEITVSLLVIYSDGIGGGSARVFKKPFSVPSLRRTRELNSVAASAFTPALPGVFVFWVMAKLPQKNAFMPCGCVASSKI